MQNWTFHDVKLNGDGTATARWRTADFLSDDPKIEWCGGQVVVEGFEGRSGLRMDLAGLQRLRTLVDQEIQNLEALLSGGR